MGHQFQTLKEEDKSKANQMNKWELRCYTAQKHPKVHLSGVLIKYLPCRMSLQDDDDDDDDDGAGAGAGAGDDAGDEDVDQDEDDDDDDDDDGYYCL